MTATCPGHCHPVIPPAHHRALLLDVTIADDVGPVAQGSTRTRGGRVAQGSSEGHAERLDAWRNLVAMRTRERWRRPALTGPCWVTAEFRMRRPASRRHEVFVATFPDGDKLARALGDALTMAGVVTDDKVIQWGGAWAIYHPHPGVRFTVEAIELDC